MGTSPDYCFGNSLKDPTFSSAKLSNENVRFSCLIGVLQDA